MSLSVVVALSCAPAVTGSARAEAGTDPAAARADLSANVPPDLRLAPALVGRVSSRLPARYTARPTILIGGAIGTSDLHTLEQLEAVSGHSSTGSSPLIIRPTLAQRRVIRRAERRTHRRAILAIRLTGTFGSGATAQPHFREFVIQR